MARNSVSQRENVSIREYRKVLVVLKLWRLPRHLISSDQLTVKGGTVLTVL
jgi:hypothetical protein